MTCKSRYKMPKPLFERCCNLFDLMKKTTPTAITNGVKISVEPAYEGYVQGERKYIFSYRVFIENRSPDTVQLLSRHWKICDSTGGTRTVEGEGVIGQQPVLAPGQLYEYSSWCPLDGDIGMMYGHYVMQRDRDGALLRITVPAFTMVATARLS